MVNKYDNAKIQLGIAISRHRENKPVKLRLNNVSGVFILWAIGISISTMIFIIEMFWYKIFKKNRLNRDLKKIRMHWSGQVLK